MRSGNPVQITAAFHIYEQLYGFVHMAFRVVNVYHLAAAINGLTKHIIAAPAYCANVIIYRQTMFL